MNRKRFKNVESYKGVERIIQNKYVGIADMNGLYEIPNPIFKKNHKEVHI